MRPCNLIVSVTHRDCHARQCSLSAFLYISDFTVSPGGGGASAVVTWTYRLTSDSVTLSILVLRGAIPNLQPESSIQSIPPTTNPGGASDLKTRKRKTAVRA